MDRKEAIERLFYLKSKAENALINSNSHCDWLINDVKGTINAFSLAIEALDKQIPKKPVFNSGSFHFCPTCVDENKTVSYDFLLDRNQKYCRRCGQKILWEVEE